MTSDKAVSRPGTRKIRVSGKNGSIEFLRFLFTTVIILFHINLDLWDQKKVVTVLAGHPVAFFHHGNLAVEFFFLVTGFLMARSVWKDPDHGNLQQLPARTARFLFRKARALLPYYLPACLLTPLVRLLTGQPLNADYFIQRVPSLFFLQRAGLGRPYIGCTWYLSSMLIALAAAYPLCCLFYRTYTRAAAPVLCFVILSAILLTTGSLGEIDDWFLFTYKTNFRAFAEISMGACGFEVSRCLSGKRLSSLTRVLLSAAAVICLALTLAFLCSFMPNSLSLFVFCLLFVLIVISFSGEGALARTGFFSHPVFLYLGSISLPMYVSQTLFRRSIPYYFSGSSPWLQCFLIYTGILLFSVAMHAAVTAARAGRRSTAPSSGLPSTPGHNIRMDSV